MLQLLLIIPLLGAAALLPFSTDAKGSSFARYLDLTSEARMKQVALFSSLVNFVISMVMWAQFDSSVSHYQFQEEFTQISFCHLHLGIDGISLYFVLLTTFITPICILSNWHDIKVGLKYFLIAFLVLETLQIAVFVVLDLLLFYIFFESVLIPLFLIVGIWGASEARIRASFLLFLYTLAGSLFMLLAIMVIYYNVGSTDFELISLSEISASSQKLLWLAFFLSFAVKTPLFPFHIWKILCRYFPIVALSCGSEFFCCDLSFIEGYDPHAWLLLSSITPVKPQLTGKSEEDTSNSRALVVYGTNLGSSVGKNRFTKSLSSMYVLHPYQMSVAIGLLLSDGYFLFSGHKKNASLALEQSLAKLEYFFNVYLSLTHYCSSGPQFRSRTRFGTLNHSLRFFTRALPCFTELFDLFYKNGTKVVPENIITLLDPVALAH